MSNGVRTTRKDNVTYLNNRPKRTQVKKVEEKRVQYGYDFSILFVVMLLVMLGIVMVFSSSYYSAATSGKFNEDMYFFLRKQGLWAIIGTCLMLLVMNFDYRRYKLFASAGYIGINALLLAVLLTASAINGSRRWLDTGFGIGLQPSEIAKLIMIIFMAMIVSGGRQRLNSVKGFIFFVAFIIPPVVLVGRSNLSTAIVIAFACFAILFVASPKVWYFVAMIVPAGAAGAAAIILEPYRFDRIAAWLDPFKDATDKGFQAVQSLFAVASGGLFGLGLGQSRQKLGFIPEAYNDIIFSIICEELGLVGACTLLMLYIFLIWRGIRIAINTQDLFGSLIACGIVAMVAVQVLINVAVNTNTIPVTGMALPFISYGGSSLSMLMVSMGVLLNISKYSKV